MTMVVLVTVVELHLPAARSLKDKRRVVKGLIERIHARHRVSIAETDFHDLHQRSEIAIAAVHQSASHVERLLEVIRSQFDEQPEALVVRWEPEFFRA
ncbi:MAG: DUF503 domain-containing protein [Thermoanaerobaculia bacterium]